MRVKVGNKVYDAEDEPLLVMLSREERDEIAHMIPGATKYCVYPATEEWTKDGYKKIKEWMDVSP